jgi:hypothetical protein
MIAVTALADLIIDGKLSLRAGASSTSHFDFHSGCLDAWTLGQRAMSDAIMVAAGHRRDDAAQWRAGPEAMSDFAMPTLLRDILGGRVLFAMMVRAQVRHETEADPSSLPPARKQGSHKELLP